MKPITTFFFVFTLCLLIVLPQEIAANQEGVVTEQIKQACEHTAHKSLCLSTLSSDPSSQQAANLTILAQVALSIASQNASDITDLVKTLVNDQSLEPRVQQALADCLDHYLDAAEQLDDSLAALTVGAHEDLKTWVHVAIGDAGLCDAGFKGLKENVMFHRNKVFHQLCQNALAIAEVSLSAAGKWIVIT